MKPNSLILLPILLPLTLPASSQPSSTDRPDKNDLGKLVFEDNFERNETQELVDEPGNGWKTDGDKPWSKGPKQADLRDGVLHVTPVDGKEARLLLIREINLRNGSIAFRFRMPTEQDEFRIVIADKNLKNVHAGHVLSASLAGAELRLIDMLTGGMDPVLWKKKKDGTLTNEDKRFIATKKKTFPYLPRPGVWQAMLLTMHEDTLSISIDGELIGSFASEGFAHPTKTILRLGAMTSASIDDVRIYDYDAE